MNSAGKRIKKKVFIQCHVMHLIKKNLQVLGSILQDCIINLFASGLPSYCLCSCESLTVHGNSGESSYTVFEFRKKMLIKCR